MSLKLPLPPMRVKGGRLGILASLFAVIYSGNGWAVCNYQDIDVQNLNPPNSINGNCPGGNAPNAIYDNQGGVGISDQIAACSDPPPTSASVTCKISTPTTAATVTCPTSTPSSFTCNDASGSMSLAVTGAGLCPLHFSGSVPAGFVIFNVTATDNLGNQCKRTYNFNTLGTHGGWGDPHIITVDNVHYNFQSAGEFTALRGDKLEIQTRQTPIATTFLPGADPYDNVRTCVSLYSAVAARVGARRVTYEPNINGVPDPSGMQLRIDGALTTLGAQGMDLGSGARIVPSGGGGIEVNYPDGTILAVTPAYWNDQQKWYLNVVVSQAIAHQGIFGAMALRSWLPALPDGTSLGPMPESLHQRYVALYEKFADAWRVTDGTSLFDYGPGQSTASFNLPGWPRENPTSCAIPKEPSAQPVDVNVAEQHCKAVVDERLRADCVFDVSVTGHTGYADTYVKTQNQQPGATKTTVKGDRAISAPGENVTFTASVELRARRGAGVSPPGALQFLVDGAKAGAPMVLDTGGHAQWSTASLAVGAHQIGAEYTPAVGWGGPFLVSNSPEESHLVVATNGLPLWLILLLVILLLAVAIWWFMIKK